MRSLTIASIAATVLFASSAYAAPAGSGEVVAASAIPVEVISPNKFKLEDSEFGDLKGRYHLSNGASMRLSSFNHKFFAELDQYGKVEITPINQNLFVSRDRDLRIDFETESVNGKVRVAYTPKQ